LINQSMRLGVNLPSLVSTNFVVCTALFIYFYL
jgi:hypothetical protein